VSGAGAGAIVEARGIGVELGGATILDGVDLELRAGEVLALLGPNGAGKSTLLAALCGDVERRTGTVTVTGRPVPGTSARELARVRAVLLQQVTVSFPFTVDQVVTMGRAPWAGTEAEDDDEARVAQAMADADVADLADRQVTTLSGGERSRVALARVLAQETPVLLLDEPTAALDLHHQELVLSRVRAHADAGGAAVVVLHDLTLAAAWADRVQLLEHGRVAAVGTPAQVLVPELLSRVYGCPVEVLEHPRTGALLVVPFR